MFLCAPAGHAFSQPVPSPDAPWSGWAQCRISIQGPGYSDQQTQTWTMTGGAPASQGAIRLHPATWSATGSGSLQRSQGSQSLMAQWTRSADGISAPISVVVRASDGRLLIRSGHAQLRPAGGIVGTQNLMIDGKPASSTPIRAEAFEWAFPAIEGAAAATHITGSASGDVPGSFGPMQPAGSRTTTACSWDFARAGSTASAAPPAPATPPVSPAPPPAGTATTPAPPSSSSAPPSSSSTGPERRDRPPVPRMVTVPTTPGTPPPPAGETPIATQPVGPPPVDTVPPDPYEPNNSADQARSIGELRMRAPALVIQSTFDSAADTDDYFTVRILDDGSAPDPNVLKHTDHHLVTSFTNPAYTLGDYPLYQITVTGTTGVAYTRTSETQMSPTVTVPWPKTSDDDSKTFLVRIRRISGQPSDNKYRLVLQAD